MVPIHICSLTFCMKTSTLIVLSDTLWPVNNFFQYKATVLSYHAVIEGAVSQQGDMSHFIWIRTLLLGFQIEIFGVNFFAPRESKRNINVGLSFLVVHVSVWASVCQSNACSEELGIHSKISSKKKQCLDSASNFQRFRLPLYLSWGLDTVRP